MFGRLADIATADDTGHLLCSLSPSENELDNPVCSRTHMEQVKPIPGHITYGATPDGRIFCLRKETTIRPCIDACGYAWVWLTHKTGTTRYLVSHLVATTFIPNTENKPEVDHIDRNRGNNEVSNLRWADDYDQAINRIGWGKHRRYIYMENYGTYECWTLQIKNHKLQIKRRFDCRTHTLDQVIEVRNGMLQEHDIPITD